MDKKIKIDGHVLKISNLDKIFWPKLKLTKGDLFSYYDEISECILPHLLDRPEALNRFPNGVTKENFYQKNIENPPSWMKVYRDIAEDDGHKVNYLVCNNLATMFYIINLGAIDFNIWSSRIPNPSKPDFLVFDLDPVEIDFKCAVETALATHELLNYLKIDSYVKTSGKRGIHIYAPIKNKYTFDEVRDFAHLLMIKIHEELPKTTSLERHPNDRQGRVYLDYLQNREGATMAAPYSVRPIETANVSTPLSWKEMTSQIKPEDFNMMNTPARLKRTGDIFFPVLKGDADLKSALDRIKH